MAFIAVVLGYCAGMLVQYAGARNGYAKLLCRAIAVCFGVIAGILIA